MSQRGPNEADTCREFVLPMLEHAGWTPDQILPEYPVVARRIVRGSAAERELGRGRVDYVLEVRPGVPTVVIEVKREYAAPTEGIQQAIRYAQQLRVRRISERWRAAISVRVTPGEALMLPPLDQFGGPRRIAAAFGGSAAYHEQVDTLQRWLYADSA